MKKPEPVSNLMDKELTKIDDQFENYNDELKSLGNDINSKPRALETEPQTKISQNEIAESAKLPGTYLKPSRIIMSQQKFNEKFRKDREYDSEYVYFIAEHKELIGEKIEMWTKPYGGMPYEFWEIPTNKPIWAPRYVAEQIKGSSYRRLKTNEHQITGNNAVGQTTGQLIAESTIQRLDALPQTTRKSIFMGVETFK